MLKIGLLGIVLISMSACSWINPIEGAETVAVLQSDEVSQCVKLGSSSTTTLFKVGFYQRDAEAMKKELIKLAQNEAIKMQGDSIVANSELIEGQMSFDIYRCNNVSKK
ncbi:MAG: DUF4156 domain-containing protein [Thiomicrorhabdus sp.]|jgi:hypothetical protein|nr:DUF4156 domain-containing protein [Thiomicrorhabdus sp.]